MGDTSSALRAGWKKRDNSPVTEVTDNGRSPFGRPQVCKLLIHSVLLILLVGFTPPAAADSSESIPSRIITIAPNASEIICALGECERIVGVDKFCVYPPELKSRPQVGGLFDPDLEKIVSLRPDLVVIRGKSESLEKLCADLKIRVYHDPTERMADIERTAIELGKILKKEDAAKKLVDEFQAKIKAIQERVQDRPRPRVLLTVSRRPDEVANILTTGKGTFLDDMITIAGGVNVFGDVDAPWPQVSLESIVAKQPEVIIELMPGEEVDEKRLQELRDQWIRSKVIGREAASAVHIVTEENALIPSVRCVELMSKFSSLIR